MESKTQQSVYTIKDGRPFTYWLFSWLLQAGVELRLTLSRTNGLGRGGTFQLLAFLTEEQSKWSGAVLTRQWLLIAPQHMREISTGR